MAAISGDATGAILGSGFGMGFGIVFVVDFESAKAFGFALGVGMAGCIRYGSRFWQLSGDSYQHKRQWLKKSQIAKSIHCPICANWEADKIPILNILLLAFL